MTLNLPAKFQKDQSPGDMAKFIFARWLKKGSNDEVNVSAEELAALLKAKTEPEMFKVIESEIERSLIESWMRFLIAMKKCLPGVDDVPAKFKEKKFIDPCYTFAKGRPDGGRAFELLAALHLFRGDKLASVVGCCFAPAGT